MNKELKNIITNKFKDFGVKDIKFTDNNCTFTKPEKMIYPDREFDKLDLDIMDYIDAKPNIKLEYSSQQ